MLDAPWQAVVDWLPDSEEVNATEQEFGDQSVSSRDSQSGSQWPSASSDRDDASAPSLLGADDSTVTSQGSLDSDTSQPDVTGDVVSDVDRYGDGGIDVILNEHCNHALLRNQPIGDPLKLPKPDGWRRTRVCMQNPNGIQVVREGKWKVNCYHQRDMGVDWMGYSGSDLNTQEGTVRSRLNNDAESVFGYKGFKLVASHTNREATYNRKPGGTMALVVGWLQDKVCATGKDAYGRWVYTKIRGNQGRMITFICTYQVCQTDQVNVQGLGESTFAKQQLAMFMEEGRRDPRRLRYHHQQDLLKFVQECQNAGELVCVGGDFNEELGLEAADGLAKLCTECGLMDPILAKHGRTDFDTYIRGSKVLDYFLIPQELQATVLDCGYEPYNIRTLGDHRAFYVDFDTTKLLGGKPTFSCQMDSRDITSKRYHQIPIYFKSRTKHLDDHKFYTQLEQLRQCVETDTPNDQLAQKLDTRFQRSALYAGGQCQRYPNVPYSPTIARLRNVCQLLRQAITQLRHSYDMSESI